MGPHACADLDVLMTPACIVPLFTVLAPGLQPRSGVCPSMEVAAWDLPATLCAHLRRKVYVQDVCQVTFILQRRPTYNE